MEHCFYGLEPRWTSWDRFYKIHVLSDRIVVFHAGRAVASLDPGATTRHEVGSLMLGMAA